MNDVVSLKNTMWKLNGAIVALFVVTLGAVIALHVRFGAEMSSMRDEVLEKIVILTADINEVKSSLRELAANTQQSEVRTHSRLDKLESRADRFEEILNQVRIELYRREQNAK